MPQPPSSAPTSRQLELFPDPVIVEAADPRTIVGPRTRVRHLFRVRLGRASPVHLVFEDRHGWYCEEHGRACPAVAAAKEHARG
ncbi:MAG TPA: hypothetical protein VFS44_09870 [Gemmatimonadaceae bacterium]|nr:hypothetical protein [Gemmatimonadaceae bacterium]